MNLRDRNLHKLNGGHFDVLIVGGGINGAVCAASLAGRGASVAVVDRGDFASFTSQESSNLVWGGFKYLENYELALVRKLCVSRNRLVNAYPANIGQIGFLAALDESAPFSPWLAGLGSVAYWAIGSLKTPRPRMLSAAAIAAEEPVINTATVSGGIEYYDAYLKDNDARFVFSFIRRAIDSGATAANYVELVDASRTSTGWRVELHDLENGSIFSCSAGIVVNAAGPFVDSLNADWGNVTDHRIVYSKGIHLVVPRLTTNERVLAFFDETQRLFYVIPMGHRSVIGTTDTRTTDAHTEVSSSDRAFLLRQINRRLNLAVPVTEADIIAERSGVRPLVIDRDSEDQQRLDWTALSRKHVIDVDDPLRIVTIFGGKLTDCLNVGEEVARAVIDLGVGLDPDDQNWFGEPPPPVREAFRGQARLMGLDDLRSLDELEPLSERLWRRYGLRAFAMLDAVKYDPTMGSEIMQGADYLRVELHLAARSEMVTRLEDFMRRRSKISLVVSQAEIRSSAGLQEVAKILFGAKAKQKLAEYFDVVGPVDSL